MRYAELECDWWEAADTPFKRKRVKKRKKKVAPQ
jgi:hypothetical protein